MSGYEIREVPAQHTAVVRAEVPIEQIGEAFGRALATVMEATGKAGVVPTGAPICVYLGQHEDGVVEFDAGVPVAEPFESTDEVAASMIGGGEAAVGVHVGPYHELGAAYDQLGEWIRGQGRLPGRVTWDSYVDDPFEVEPAQLRTEIYWALE